MGNTAQDAPLVLFLCLFLCILTVAGNPWDRDYRPSFFSSSRRQLLNADDDDENRPASVPSKPQPKKLIDPPSLEEIKKLSDSRLRKKLFLLDLPYKNLSVAEMRDSLTKALYPDIAAKLLLEKLEKQAKLEAAEAARKEALQAAEGTTNIRVF